MKGFFDDLSITPPKPSARRVRSATARASSLVRTLSGDDPCDKCPLNDGRPKIPPTLPAQPRLLVVGLGPAQEEEAQGRHLVGPGGQVVRTALRAAGLDDEADVGYLNLTRCRPDGDDFESKPWQAAQRRCRRWLDRDLQRGLPILALGSKPLRVLAGDPKVAVTGYHGLWVASQMGHRLFSLRHPAGILRAEEPARDLLLQEFYAEVATALATAAPDATALRPVPIYRTPREAQGTLAWLAQHPHPWAFDVESYDAIEYPSRQRVSTDPCHPDFRLRGVAIAIGSDRGFWLELNASEKTAWRAILEPCFASGAEKWAFSGHFDEEALVYPGWVSRVTRRWGDGMLALVSLSGGQHPSLRLERAVVDLLGRPQYWGGADKSRLRDAPIEQVAAGAVEDAMACFALCVHLHGRMQRGEYLTA